MEVSSLSGDVKAYSGHALVRILAPILLLLASIVFCLVALEILFRLIAPQLEKPEWQDRPVRYFAPEAAKTFQDYPYSPTKPANTYRIAVVGDSFTFGPYIHFDDTYVKRIERWLNLNQNQPKVEVINYGVPRYSTSHEIDVVKRAIREQADLIILQITLNDPELKPYRPTGLLRDQVSGGVKLEGAIYKYWRSLAYVVSRVLNTRTHTEYRDYFYKLFDDKGSYGQFERSLKTIARMGRDSSIPIAAVVFPLFGYAVDKHYPFFPIHQRVIDLLSQIGLPSVDIATRYQGIPIERLQVILGKDRHPNEIGHRIAAEAILDWLPSTKLIPEALFPKRSYPDRIGILFDDQGEVER